MAPPNRVLAISGAGISASSGIPTFRGDGGYWNNYDVQRLATAEMFRKEPLLVWRWYSERRVVISRAQPNIAHAALVRLARATSDFLLIAQNVDDLERRAGMPDEKFVQIHGDIFSVRCRNCGFHAPDRAQHVHAVPKCPNCGRDIGPGVVWFDEGFHPERERRLNGFLDSGPCDLVIVVGTSVPFPEVKNWALAGKGATGLLIEVNPQPTALTPHAGRIIRADAAAVMDRLVDEVLAGAYEGSE